ncbi:hypothetical protein E2C01_071974 [Portunus trituberculatus]|uniref:Uncharacterized protein n=1 Tax=Portunus trituberculatus TaxID=210409 RepID=A0A5B7I7P2_PORTR|nr:hypothetical protein [Portunus trituberculatus]
MSVFCAKPSWSTMVCPVPLPQDRLLSMALSKLTCPPILECVMAAGVVLAGEGESHNAPYLHVKLQSGG